MLSAKMKHNEYKKEDHKGESIFVLTLRLT